MLSRLTWWRTLTGCLAAATMVGASGCLSFMNPVDKPTSEISEPCQNIPQCCRDHVYIFLIHGLDPLDLANLSGVRDYCQNLGFKKVYYGQLYHRWYFQDQVRRIHREDPEARFVLIGFSFGANMVCGVAQTMNKEGIPVDLLVYLGGNTLKNTKDDQPENARRIINILATGAIWHGDNMERAENVQVPDRWHFGSPSHPNTLQTLARELAVVAAAVPPRDGIDPSQPIGKLPESGKPFMPVSRKRESGEWDFLKPANELQPPKPLPGQNQEPRLGQIQ